MKRYKRIYQVVFYLMSFAFLVGCLDELEIETLNEDEQSPALVVEAVLTDEMITQKVYLSRSSNRLDLETDTIYNPYIPLGSRPIESVDMEGGATVRVLGDNGAEYQFTEGEEGTYLSNQQFALEMGVGYTLEIVTNNGLEYISDPLSIQGSSQITDIYAEKAFNDSGEEGVAIYVDSQPMNGENQFFKYVYEETYKIIPPFTSEFEFVLTDYDPCALPEPTYNLEVVEKTEPNICFNTVVSDKIVQGSTLGGSSSGVSKQMVRFIGKDNFIISHRYSILVQQQVQSADAYSFYENLNAFSKSDNIFSQIQPGALYANVQRKDGTSENILGYVEAVAVSEQRLFFNYEDFFPDEELPPFPFNCALSSPPESHVSYCYSGPPGPTPCPTSIIESVDLGLISFYGYYGEYAVPDSSCAGPYIVVPRICGDCLLGEKIEPDFWEE